jgi:hypothetical protein
LPQTTTGIQCKANQSNDIIDLAEKAPQRYNNHVLGVGFPRYAVGVWRRRYGAVCSEHSALPGILFCFAFRNFIIMACKPESKVFFILWNRLISQATLPDLVFIATDVSVIMSP